MTPLQDPGPGRLRDIQASRGTTSWVWLLGLSLSRHHPLQFPLKGRDNPRPRNNQGQRLLLCLGRIGSGQGIRFGILGTGSVRQEKLESVKEQGPSGMPRVQPLSPLEIFQVLVVRENLERVLSPFKPMAPLLQGEFNPLRFLKNLPKTPKKGIPKVNCMLFLDHLDDMHGVDLL